MLARESLAIAAEIGDAIERARGAEARATDFRSFDTICSATQERQDAVRELIDEGVDVMVVIGGFNSSNTMSLAALCADAIPTYHIETAAAIDPERRSIHYRPAAIKHSETDQVDWIPEGPVRVGVTAGASTPNNKIGDVVRRILATRGLPAPA
jgi:4-hydroxy-3-methylbut-2-enyl diphosphate reductase